MKAKKPEGAELTRPRPARGDPAGRPDRRPEGEPMYAISTWDPGDGPDDDFGWVERARAATLWALRDSIREVRRYYAECSYLIERVAAEPGP